MTAPLRALEVWREDDLVGTLLDGEPIRFRYAPDWLNTPGATAVCPTLPLGGEEHAGDAVFAFFENLLPEAELRRHLSTSRHATTVFGLLYLLGGDSASDLSLLLPGETPQVPQYQATSWQEIATRRRGPDAAPMFSEAEQDARLSLAGAQDKMLLFLLSDGTPTLPRDSAPSTHILKPDIVRHPGVWASAVNETFSMELASALGLEVAEVSYQPLVKACLVKRYDRYFGAHGALRRLHQLDLCQLDGKPSDGKYESDGGPNLARCRVLLQQNNVPASDLKRLVEWVFFNLYIGNHDSHAKNLALLHTRDQGPRLAPFYDLMATSIYSGLSRKFAFSVGGEFMPGNLQARHLEEMARQLGFKPAWVLRLARLAGEAMLEKLEPVAAATAAQANPGSERILLERLEQSIRSNIKKLLARWAK